MSWTSSPLSYLLLNKNTSKNLRSTVAVNVRQYDVSGKIRSFYDYAYMFAYDFAGALSIFLRCEITASDIHKMVFVEIADYDLLDSEEFLGTTTTREPLPYFDDHANLTNLTAPLGSTAFLHCRVNLLKDKTVSNDDTLKNYVVLLQYFILEGASKYNSWLAVHS